MSDETIFWVWQIFRLDFFLRGQIVFSNSNEENEESGNINKG